MGTIKFRPASGGPSGSGDCQARVARVVREISTERCGKAALASLEVFNAKGWDILRMEVKLTATVMSMTMKRRDNELEGLSSCPET
jgi:hypothetical protein